MGQQVGPLVLIVDDDDGVRAILARAVQLAGYTPVEAISGDDGYKRVTELADRVALVILDITMAGLDGFGFRRLQLDDSRVADIPTMVLTGGELDITEFMALGLHIWVQKPISIDYIVSAIQQYARDVGGAAGR